MKVFSLIFWFSLVGSFFWHANTTAAAPLVLTSDFGLKDGAVAAMKGVALSEAPQLTIHDLTHEIPPYNI